MNKISGRDYEKTDAGEASFLVFKGFDYKLDATNKNRVKIIFPAKTDDTLMLIVELRKDWVTGSPYRSFLKAYQNLVRAIKSVIQMQSQIEKQKK